jgi:tripeptidyl-peptidase-1
MEKLEKLFHTEMYTFEHIHVESKKNPTSSRFLVRAVFDIYIPSPLKSFIAYTNLNTHPLHLCTLSSSSTRKVSRTTKAIDQSNTLSLLRETYRIPADLVVTNETNSQCTPSFYQESWDPLDLDLFFQEFIDSSSDKKTTRPKIIEKGDRLNKPEEASLEASLDVQYLTGMARNATTFVWTMNGSNPYSKEDEPFLEFAQQVLELKAPPYVISISYSDDEEQIFRVAQEYARSFDILLLKMGLRGISVLVASGDDGVSGLRPEFSQPKLSPEQACDQSGPQWPSSSPYVTSVGATMFLHNEYDSKQSKNFYLTTEEVVCSGEIGGVITTGGGFSNVYSIPPYQAKAVQDYLTRHQHRLPSRKGFFNQSGRAYPDISAYGNSFSVYMHGHLSVVSGTSASTPTISAMVTLWNDARLNAGKPTLGFLNPLIYFLNEKYPEVFNDIVVGNNGALRNGNKICDDSFGASSGWDAVTGVGTPDFSKILDLVKRLQDGDLVISPAAATGNSSSAEQDACNKVDNSNGIGSIDSSSNNGSGVALTIVVVLTIVGLIGLLIFCVVKKPWREENKYHTLTVDHSSGGKNGINTISTSPNTRKQQDNDKNINNNVIEGDEEEKKQEEAEVLSEINLQINSFNNNT